MDCIVIKDMQVLANHCHDVQVLFGNKEAFEHVETQTSKRNFLPHEWDDNDWLHGNGIAKLNCDTLFEAGEYIYEFMYTLNLERVTIISSTERKTLSVEDAIESFKHWKMK
jgi:hypothetical protein